MSYAYNAFNDLTAITRGDGAVYERGYNAFGQMMTEKRTDAGADLILENIRKKGIILPEWVRDGRTHYGCKRNRHTTRRTKPPRIK